MDVYVKMTSILWWACPHQRYLCLVEKMAATKI